MKLVPNDMRRIIMTDQTSRINKLWIVISWKQLRGYYVEWKWAGEEMRSRLLFQWDPGEGFIPAKSFDEDVFTKLKSQKEP